MKVLGLIVLFFCSSVFALDDYYKVKYAYSAVKTDFIEDQTNTFDNNTTTTRTSKSLKKNFIGLGYGFRNDKDDRLEFSFLVEMSGDKTYLLDIEYKITRQFGEGKPYFNIGLSNLIQDNSYESSALILGLGIINPLSKDLSVDFALDYKNHNIDEEDNDLEFTSFGASLNYKF